MKSDLLLSIGMVTAFFRRKFQIYHQRFSHSRTLLSTRLADHRVFLFMHDDVHWMFSDRKVGGSDNSIMEGCGKGYRHSLNSPALSLCMLSLSYRRSLLWLGSLNARPWSTAPLHQEVFEWQYLITLFPPREITPNLLILLTEAQPLWSGMVRHFWIII